MFPNRVKRKVVRYVSILGMVALTLTTLGCGGPVACFHVSNNLPKDNPCDNAEVPSSVYADLRKTVDDVRKSKVIRAILDQIEAAIKAKNLKPHCAEVEIEIAKDADAYKKSYNGDRPAAGDQLTEDQAKDRFEKHDGYTHTTTTEPQKIKIVIFCKTSLQQGGKGQRVLVHELVHAKLFAMELAGIPKGEPFGGEDDPKWQEGQNPRTGGHPEDHNERFNKEVEDLLKLLE
jgi:hypothetical protein